MSIQYNESDSRIVLFIKLSYQYSVTDSQHSSYAMFFSDMYSRVIQDTLTYTEKIVKLRRNACNDTKHFSQKKKKKKVLKTDLL